MVLGGLNMVLEEIKEIGWWKKVKNIAAMKAAERNGCVCEGCFLYYQGTLNGSIKGHGRGLFIGLILGLIVSYIRYS